MTFQTGTDTGAWVFPVALLREHDGTGQDRPEPNHPIPAPRPHWAARPRTPLHPTGSTPTASDRGTRLSPSSWLRLARPSTTVQARAKPCRGGWPGVPAGAVSMISGALCFDRPCRARDGGPTLPLRPASRPFLEGRGQARRPPACPLVPRVEGEHRHGPCAKGLTRQTPPAPAILTLATRRQFDGEGVEHALGIPVAWFKSAAAREHEGQRRLCSRGPT